MADKNTSKLVIIDGNAIIHRAYHAMPPLTTPNGDPINAVYGLISMFLRILQDLKPTHIAVAWDRPEPTFRQKEYKNYQAQRPEVDADLISQFSKAREAVASFGIVQFDKVGFEADDVIGTLATKVIQSGRVEESKKTKKTPARKLSSSPALIDEVIIVTGDKDQLQLVNEKVKVYLPVKGLGDAKLMSVNDVKDKMGVTPMQVIDLKGLMGDQSDNYPGVRGVGPKTAIQLLDEYGSFENIYRNLDKLPETLRKKFVDGRADADMSFKLARIITNVDIDLDINELKKWNIGDEKTLKLFDVFGFRTLKRRLLEMKEDMIDEKQGKLF